VAVDFQLAFEDADLLVQGLQLGLEARRLRGSGSGAQDKGGGEYGGGSHDDTP
jgi:hypothetical protein